MPHKTITFDKHARNEILEMLKLSVDKDGYIVENKNPHKRVVTPSGSEIKLDSLAGVKRGSLLLFKSDLPSLIELADRLK